MAQTNPNTIVLKTSDQHRTLERVAGGAISPGHLLQLNSSNQLVKQSTSAGPVLKLFALEKEYDGKGITGAYASGDTVIAGDFQSGDEVYARLAAGATAIVIGDKLIAHTDGTLKKTGATTDFFVAVALEAVDNSGGGAEAMIKVKLI